MDIEDVGAMASFLVSDAEHHVTGIVLPIDSGQRVMPEYFPILSGYSTQVMFR